MIAVLISYPSLNFVKLCIYYFCQYSIVSLTTESCFVNELFVFQFCYLQDPAEADKLLKIQRDLDETKIILVSSCMFSDPRKHKYKACRNPMELFSCMRARQRGHQGKVLHCYGS